MALTILTARLKLSVPTPWGPRTACGTISRNGPRSSPISVSALPFLFSVPHFHASIVWRPLGLVMRTSAGVSVVE